MSPRTGLIEPGLQLPERRVHLTLLDVVRFAAAMWDFQRLHYDDAWARIEGLPRSIAQGPLLVNHLVQTVESALHPKWVLLRIEWRHLAPALVGDTVVCGGETVTPVEPGTLRLGVWIRSTDDCDLVSGTAELRPGNAA
jgi:hydroxyacyl-ACP dehydratase HTD2-like protein with hotdog domain